jgi:hypothetical protein
MSRVCVFSISPRIIRPLAAETEPALMQEFDDVGRAAAAIQPDRPAGSSFR